MSFIIKDDHKIQNKIIFFKNNINNFHLVADFDGTLNTYFDREGNKSQSIISLLYNNHILDEDYSQKAKNLYNHYIKIEHDTTLSLEIRQGAMEERWTKHKELLMEKGLNYHHLEQIIQLNKLVMRSGTDTLLQKMNDNNIPVVIFSASGVGVDSIRLLLHYRGLDLPNIHIISNKLYRSENGDMIGYSKPIIHSLNKEESVIWSNSEYKELQENLENRSHAIVIGDNIHDAHMVDPKPGRIILSIGLCNDKVEERIEEYSSIFDMVITHDEGFEDVIEKIGL